ncbi:MAG TPA: RNA 2',3'-cyclic phosphodiesterase [Actinobacteria bacterium]|nr:RNA 2',3'-cyclic phosphodiesterase [Actinomycetota bacterium]
MKRIFIAADIRQDIREIIYKFAQRNFSYSDNTRLIIAENLHITFKFLGNTPDKEIFCIKETIKKSVSGFGYFKYCLEDSIGAFPDKRRARILFIGIEEGREKFKELHSSIETGLDRMGIVKDSRSFYPHITFARMSPALSIEEGSIRRGPVPTALKCSRISLYESILGAERVKYINIGRFSLK